MQFRMLNRFLLMLLLLVTAAGACKLARKAGETDAQFKERQKAVFVAQSTLGLDGWSGGIEILGNGSALDAETRRLQYTLNEQVLSGLDIVRERLKNPITGDALAKLKGVLLDVREAERREVVKISNPDTRQQVEAIFEVSIFALESLQAVLEASTQPTRADLEARTDALVKKSRAAIPDYLLPLIALARDTGFEALRISRLTTADAWAKAEALSMALHSKNQARLAALGTSAL